MLVAGAAPLDFFVLELALVVDVCFAVSECPLLVDNEADVAAAAAGWLDVAAEASTAMLKARIPKSCMSTVVVVRLEVCRLLWIDGVDELCLSGNLVVSSPLLYFDFSVDVPPFGDYSCFTVAARLVSKQE